MRERDQRQTFLDAYVRQLIADEGLIATPRNSAQDERVYARVVEDLAAVVNRYSDMVPALDALLHLGLAVSAGTDDVIIHAAQSESPVLFVAVNSKDAA